MYAEKKRDGLMCSSCAIRSTVHCSPMRAIRLARKRNSRADNSAFTVSPRPWHARERRMSSIRAAASAISCRCGRLELISSSISQMPEVMNAQSSG